jgi:hypothetical protein
VRDNLRVKDVRRGKGDDIRRIVVRHNPAEVERDSQLARLEAELARTEQMRRTAKTNKQGEAHIRTACTLRDHPTLSRHPRQTSTGKAAGRPGQDHSRRRLDGKCLLSFSDPDLSPRRRSRSATRTCATPNAPSAT